MDKITMLDLKSSALDEKLRPRTPNVKTSTVDQSKYTENDFLTSRASRYTAVSHSGNRSGNSSQNGSAD